MYNWKTTIQTEQIKNEFCVGNITYPKHAKREKLQVDQTYLCIQSKHTLFTMV